jgi:hypothetical protein
LRVGLVKRSSTNGIAAKRIGFLFRSTVKMSVPTQRSNEWNPRVRFISGEDAMKRRDWLTGLGLIAFLTLLAVFFFPAPDLKITDVQQAAASIKKSGFHCVSDRADGRIEDGFVVSRKKTTWEEANGLCKVGPMTPAWKGKVWVGAYKPERNWTIPDDALARIWGGVYAFGDRELLAAIEDALRKGDAGDM